MNIGMHGDGSVNLFQSNSLAAPREWEDESAKQKVKQDVFGIVVTNPPFGGKAHIDDQQVLDQLQTAGVGDERHA